MATLDDVAYLDAMAQAELVRQKEVKPSELVEAAIARIERLNPALNAVITPMYELARTAAAQKLPARTLWRCSLSFKGPPGIICGGQDDTGIEAVAGLCAGSRQRTGGQVQTGRPDCRRQNQYAGIRYPSDD